MKTAKINNAILHYIIFPKDLFQMGIERGPLAPQRVSYA